ncbi:hypothetical protein PF66_05809 [Pseudomonas asplenii]|uniref:Uncharacterized protein n=1 Tax=Pseudomonas asplenii TaxID=53407 RepID=A0A0M9GCQ8_9PSED|nr:hypothetical protein [Pseudomonas fuscovaginae]KPA87851.1 hypothetical protein PF66_05809 [Pseudomonas fuscovaginae]
MPIDTQAIATFRVLPQSQLDEEAFDDYPVWSEYYDHEEIDDVVRWGLDRELVLQLFKVNAAGNEHCVYTLLESNPFPLRMRLFVRASIETADGKRLKGYVVNEDAYCLTIFHEGESFHFSTHPLLKDLNQEHERALLAALGNEAQVFPVRYHTEFNDTDGQLIAGTFLYGGQSASIG